MKLVAEVAQRLLVCRLRLLRIHIHVLVCVHTNTLDLSPVYLYIAIYRHLCREPQEKEEGVRGEKGRRARDRERAKKGGGVGWDEPAFPRCCV